MGFSCRDSAILGRHLSCVSNLYEYFLFGILLGVEITYIDQEYFFCEVERQLKKRIGDSLKRMNASVDHVWDSVQERLARSKWMRDPGNPLEILKDRSFCFSPLEFTLL